MNGKSDKWFRTVDIHKYNFQKADPIWGGNFEDLTVFNLDPKFTEHLHKIDCKFLIVGVTNLNQTKQLKYLNHILMTKIKFSPPPELEPVEDFSLEVPKYKDFFM